MKRKHIFFDYDGTLASRTQGRVPASALDAVRRLRERGHSVSLATGRLQANAVELAAAAGIDSLVADGGNSVTIAGELKWMEGMPLQACKGLLGRLDAMGVPWAVMNENRLVRYAPDPSFVKMMPDYYVPTKIVPDMGIDDLTCIYKIFIPCPVGAEADIDFGKVPWVRYNPSSVYCEPTDKSVGIRKMMSLIDISPDEVVVFGDGSNDLSMFEQGWTSVAMGNAVPVLKEKADFIAKGVDDDGIFRACGDLGLI